MLLEQRVAVDSSDDEYCRQIIAAFNNAFPELIIEGGAQEPFYQAPRADKKGVIYFRDNYPRSLLHEMSHYCLAGNRRRAIDDFGYWYSPCGRSESEQLKFELVEARPQGLEKVMCEIIGLKFSASLDDFSGRPASKRFVEELQNAYQEMLLNPPATAKIALASLKNYYFNRVK